MSSMVNETLWEEWVKKVKKKEISLCRRPLTVLTPLAGHKGRKRKVASFLGGGN
jgi:hypothetical protein